MRTGWLCVFLACGLSSLALSQQGGGGFGGGGVGGGTVPTTGAEVIREHILTPGDRGEWVVDAEEGETIVANVTSAVFDPALEVVSETGTVLASNDDIRPGDQQAMVLYRFAKAGKYRVWVKGYKSAAGGPYQISLRRFLPVDVKLSSRLATSIDKTGVNWFRIPAKKGEPLVIAPTSTTFYPRVTVFAPSGEQQKGDMDSIGNQRLLRPKMDGDYYILVEGRDNARAGFNMLVTPVRRFTTTTEATTERQKLESGTVDLWKFEGAPGDIVRIDRSCTGPKVRILFDDVSGASQEKDMETAGYVFL